MNLGHRISGDRAAAIGTFLALGALYWFLRCPTFGGGDSPQHVLSAVTWGVSWPPGYPLYVMLGRFMAALPGSAMANVDGLSGLLHAGAAAVFFLLLRRLNVARVPALLATALLALSPLYWYYSEIAEVRALNDLLALLAAYWAVVWSQEKKRSALYAFAAALGFGIGHHPTFVLLIPALGYWIWAERSFPNAKRAMRAAGIFAACLALPYLILGLRVMISAPAYNLTGVETFGDVWDLFFRKNLGGPLRMVAGQGFLPAAGIDFGAFTDQLGWLFASLGSNLTGFGAGLAALGAVFTFRANRRALVFFLAWFAACALFFVFVSSQQLHLHNPDFMRAVVARFYLLPEIAIFALAGFGAHSILERVPRWCGFAALAAAIALPLALRRIDLRHGNFTMDYAREIIRGTGPSDMLVVDTDGPNFALLYLDAVEHALGDRALLIPSLFTYPPYRQWLAKRYPTLLVPGDPSPMIWDEWMRMNPGRALYAEAEWKDRLLPRFPGSAPSGVMIRVSMTPPTPESAANQALFLSASPAVTGTNEKTVLPFSMDVDLLNSYRILKQ